MSDWGRVYFCGFACFCLCTTENVKNRQSRLKMDQSLSVSKHEKSCACIYDRHLCFSIPIRIKSHNFTGHDFAGNDMDYNYLADLLCDYCNHHFLPPSILISWVVILPLMPLMLIIGPMMLIPLLMTLSLVLTGLALYWHLGLNYWSLIISSGVSNIMLIFVVIILL